MPVAEHVVRERLGRAKEQFLDLYSRRGGHQYHGWRSASDARSYRGPTFWSEGDCVFHFARLLAEQFGDCVHINFPLAAWSLGRRYDPTKDTRRFVDIAVSDLSEFEESGDSQARFQDYEHELFIEAKYAPGRAPGFRFDHVRRVEGAWEDAVRLADRLKRDLCHVAAVLLVGDDELVETEHAKYQWPDEVEVLLVSPAALAER